MSSFRIGDRVQDGLDPGVFLGTIVYICPDIPIAHIHLAEYNRGYINNRAPGAPIYITRILVRLDNLEIYNG